MAITESQLVQLCSETTTAASAAVGWIERNQRAIGAKSAGLRRELRRREMLAQRCQEAARSPMCIGVFGASQVGKSYLVSALARKGTGPLIALLDKERDFLEEINPEAAQEATGLVTRFSIRGSPASSTHPVAVKLLNQADLVKILANTYFLDFDPTKESVPAEAAIETAFAAVEPRAKAQQIEVLSEVHIDDLRRYFEAQFASRRTHSVLKEIGYWTRLETLAPRLVVEDRVKLYSFLWGQLDEFSNVYTQLYHALERLGFAETANCPIDALIPRETSIINVNTLAGITDPARSGPPLEVRADNGRVGQIQRPHLTAIVAELLIQIKDPPWDYFKHTDLLDFPGARSREMNEDAASYVKQPDALQNLIRRGKVAYLFDRYCANGDLNSMLLCIAPGNQDVRTLPGMVTSWVHETHGESAAARVQSDTALFVVLTKFDRHFEQSKGKLKPDWTAAIETSLTTFLSGSRDNWVEEWHPGDPFNNCFWLRNPSFIAPGLMKYVSPSDRREVGLLEEDQIDGFRKEYRINPEVRRHFRDPDLAWAEAFKLNDGGISYIASSVSPVCRPELKRAQVETRVRKLRQEIAAALQEFHVSDNRDEERAKRIEASRKAVQALQNVIRGLRFGHFLRELQVSNDELQFLFRRMSMTGEVVAGPEPDVGQIMDEIGLLPEDGVLPSDRNGQARQRDPFTDLAGAAIEHWTERLRGIAQEARKLGFLRVEPEAIEIIVRELLAATERLSLTRKMAVDMQQVAPPVEKSSVDMLAAAMASAERINHFVWKLDQDSLEPAQRAQIRPATGKTDYVFRDRPEIDRIAELPEHGEVFYQSFIRDWCASFLQMVKGNVEGDIPQRFSIEQARTLNDIMTHLSS